VGGVQASQQPLLATWRCSERRATQLPSSKLLFSDLCSSGVYSCDIFSM
jgi:hypothetical protein